MNEYMNVMAEHTAANMIPLTINTYEASESRRAYASETSNRFVQAACQLPSGGLLGLQINVDHSGKPELTAFSDTGAHVSKEDYEWVFCNCAAVDAEKAVSLDAFYQEGRKVYALQCGSKEQTWEQRPHYGYVREEKTAEYQQYTDMLEEIKRTGAEMRILSHASFEGRGMILISLQNEMTLRMRAMVSRAFSITSAIELKAPDETINLLPAECLASGLCGLLKVFMRWSSDQRSSEKRGKTTFLDRWLGRNGVSDEDEFDDFDDFDEDETTRIPDRPIEELNLSIRSFNALKRAGIDTLYKLGSMSREELMQVRNLGRKCFEEIEEKLRLIEQSESLMVSAIEQPSINYADMLNELIGLRNVKEQVRRITAFARMKREMEKQGKKTAPVVFNMEFSGNPGSAKTTVARIVAGLFQEIGLLSSNEVVEVGRADLIAKYTGNTAPQVRSVFEKAKGKLLFIDEAYSLVDAWDGSFGDEAISTIVQEMENRRDESIVVFAGYPDKMEEFFSRNPGLRSRVPFRIAFPDYSADEMVQIAQLEAGKRGFTIRPEALEKVTSLCMAATQQPESGNGRYCRNLVEDAILNYASRVYGSNEESPNADYVLSDEDFPCPKPVLQAVPARKIGFAVD